ncbi:DUF6283 family protein [Streptomyces sp. NPDC015139]|uniref:DUF6283 family protein n=1 Tax=Streptomyces sp. NPDC015139 TaxID=3364942 RepID=UPI003701529C
MASSFRPPAPRPCESCPYRCDVPSGIWAQAEYDKLRAYDADTAAQPPGVFLCHQADDGSTASRVCAGWAGCHDTNELLALRLAVITGRMDSATHAAVTDYHSPVPLFPTGSDAAAHGEAGIPAPSHQARRMISKISRTRTDIVSE